MQIDRQENITTFSGIAMVMEYKILIGKQLASTEIEKIRTIIDQTFDEVDLTHNKWNPLSEISRLNQLPAHQEVKISPELERLLDITQQIVTLSLGKFDPTTEPLQKIWKDKLDKGNTPSLQELEAIAPALGWKNIHFENGKFYKEHDLTQLDLGGIAKGYCIDLLVERLQNAGYRDCFVEWGGEIRASGKHPDDRPWKVYISRLGDSDPSHAVAIVDLNDQAIATSGDYLQNWHVYEKNKRSNIYFHIFDVDSLHPLEVTVHSIASASVIADTCAIADGLATAAMIFPDHEEAKTWAEGIENRFPSIHFWIVSRE